MHRAILGFFLSLGLVSPRTILTRSHSCHGRHECWLQSCLGMISRGVACFFKLMLACIDNVAVMYGRFNLLTTYSK